MRNSSNLTEPFQTSQYQPKTSENEPKNAATRKQREGIAPIVRGEAAGVVFVQDLIGFPFILIKMHEKRGNFCIFLLKIAEKEGKTDLDLEPLRLQARQQVLAGIIASWSICYRDSVQNRRNNYFSSILALF